MTHFKIKTFSDLNKLLEFCDKLLIEHQISLMHKNHEQALLQFEQLYEIRSRHLQRMEEELLPLYESILTKFPEGGKPLYFIREKKLILKDLNRHVRFLGQLVLNPEKVKLDIVKLFEEYAWLKDLLDHHDAREKVFLFPTLEKELSEENKQKLFRDLSRFYSELKVGSGIN